jgi:hypothetical protein
MNPAEVERAEILEERSTDKNRTPALLARSTSSH